MTRRPASPRTPSVRERRAPRATKRTPRTSRTAPKAPTAVVTTTKSLAADIQRLGFTCFRLIATYDPTLSYAVRRLLETRSAMGAFAAL